VRAFGSDRVSSSGKRLIVVCPRPKGWVARVPKTYTSAEHPGTAVLWEDCYFEVVVEEISGESVRYVLEPWLEHNIMRVTDAYDEASELRREAEHRAAVKRAAGRRTANFLGVLTGHLPARVQEALGSELGILPTRLTFISLILPFLFEVWAVNQMVRCYMTGTPISLWLLLLAGYIGAESALRLQIVLSQSRPIGSTVGFILYSLFYALAPRGIARVAPLKIDKRQALLGTPPPPDIELQDAIHVREPFLTLLSPPEQLLLAKRFGYDYRRQAFRIAWVILIISMAGVVSTVAKLRDSASVSLILSLILASIVALEQVQRLATLRRGPAGSVLAFLVRPFARKLLRG